MGSHHHSSDDVLVRECLSGCEHAWTEMYSRFYPLVRNIVKRKAGFSNPEIEDLIQTVFVQIISGLGSYDSGYSLTSFVGMLAERVSIDQFRKSRAAKRDAVTDPVDHHGDSQEGGVVLLDKDHHQEEKLSRAQQAELIKEALRRLNQKCRELLRLRFYEEAPYKDITKVFGVSENTLTVQTRRCLGELQGMYAMLLRKGWKA